MTTSVESITPKSVNTSAVEEYLYKVFPEDLNTSSTLFGGKIMSILDVVASIVAERHTHRVCVTAAVDSIHFLNAAQKGDVLVCCASLNKAWRTSMEIGVRVTAKNYIARTSRHLVSAYLTFVAMDKEGRPTAVPPVIPETQIQQDRFEEAENRRLYRQQMLARRTSNRDQIN